MRNLQFNKKILLLGASIAIAVLFTGVPFAHAQAVPAAAAPTPAAAPAGNAAGTAVKTLLLVTDPGAAVGAAAGATAAAAAPALGKAAVAGGTTLVKTGDVQQAQAAAAGSLAQSATSGITSFALSALVDILSGIVGMVGFLLGLVGTLFNWVIVVTVFQYAAYFGNSGGMLIAWGIMRDLGNILLLFGFIFMGICTILDIQTFGAKKTLPFLLIFAVLLNFSLFAGELVVDGANLLSAALYQQAGQSYLSSTACPNITSTSDPASCAQVGIAGQIVQQSKLSGIYDSNGVTAPTSSNLLITYTGMIVLMGTVMIVLLAGTIMFFTRAVMLTILLVLSPIGFAGMAIPPLQGMAKEWWQKLISNAIFAPIFLLIIFVGLKIVAGIQTALPGATATSLASALAKPTVATGDVFILFALVIGFFVAALMFAKTSGVAGAEFATKFAQRTVLAPVNGARRLAGAGGSVAGGLAYRNTAGRAAAGASKLYNTQIGKLKQSKEFGWAGRFIDHGVGGAFDSGLHAAQAVKVGNRSYAEQKKYIEGRDKETAHAAETAKDKKNISDGLKIAGVAGDDLIQRAAQNLPQADLENVLKTLKAEQLARVATLLSSDKLEKALDSDDLPGNIKEGLVEGRFEAVDHAISAYQAAPTPANFTAAKEAVRALSNKEVKILATKDDALYQRMAGMTNDASFVGGTGESVWSNEQITDISKNEALTTSQRRTAFSMKKGEQLKAAVRGGGTPLTKQNLVKSMTSKDLADTNAETLTNLDVIDAMDVTDLSAIMAKDELKGGDKAIILGRVRALGAAHLHYNKIKDYLDKNGNAAAWWGGTLP